MRFDFLGQIVLGGDRPPVSARGYQPALTVARLVLERPSPLLREELAELLWPDDRPPRWEGPARQVVSRARALLVAAGAPPDVRDVARRPRGAPPRRARSRSTSSSRSRETAGGRAMRCARGTGSAPTSSTTHALERLRLPFFPASDAAWTRTLAGPRPRASCLRALHIGDRRRARRRRARRAPSRSPRRRSVSIRSTRSRRRALMAAYEALGSRGQALTAYERCRRLLDEELGVRPAEETEAAYLALLGQRAASQHPRDDRDARAPTRSEPLPFVGRASRAGRVSTSTGTRCATATRAAVVIAGEPGIGKTRLAARDRGRARGATARSSLWGACVADVGLPVPAVRRARCSNS